MADDALDDYPMTSTIAHLPRFQVLACAGSEVLGKSAGATADGGFDGCADVHSRVKQRLLVEDGYQVESSNSGGALVALGCRARWGRLAVGAAPVRTAARQRRLRTPSLSGITGEAAASRLPSVGTRSTRLTVAG